MVLKITDHKVNGMSVLILEGRIILGEETAQVYDGPHPETCAARGANLQAPMCGGLDHRSALDRLFAEHPLAKLVEPKPTARFVAFRSYFDTRRKPARASSSMIHA